MRILLVGCLSLLIALVSINAFADEKKDKIEALVKAQGLVETWQQMLDSGRGENEKQAHQVLEQLLAGLKPNEKFKARFSQAADKFIIHARSPWTAKDLVDLWARLYGPKFTEAELDEMIKYYSSSTGQKEKNVGREVLLSFTKTLREEGQPGMQKAVAQYIEDLKIIASECDCEKKD
jgi:hypothetical protein